MRAALQVAFASSLAAASGCTDSTNSSTEPALTAAGHVAAGGGSAGGAVSDDLGPDAGRPEPADAGPATAASCAGGIRERLTGLAPAEPFDFAALRVSLDGLDNGELRRHVDREQVGQACANATHVAACQTALDAAGAELALTGGGVCDYGPLACRSFVVTTRADKVTTYATVDELRTFLGTIDTPQEVFLLAEYSGYHVSCETEVRSVPDGYRTSVSVTISDCPAQGARVELHATPDGQLAEITREILPSSQPPVCAGRRPEGWSASADVVADSDVGAYFARMTELEAASVTAFERLADELAQLGAPPQLTAAAREAARDELRHAAVTGALARRFGAVAHWPCIERGSVRDLEAIALDNAVEGCVRETFGAAVGCYQARAARDPEVAQVMQGIAQDETRHAVLALQLDAWLLPQLDHAARARVEQARRRAIAELRESFAGMVASEPGALAGLPDREHSQLLYAVLARELWGVTELSPTA